jgi:hypothetical protein
MAEVSLFFVRSVTKIWQSCHILMAVIIKRGSLKFYAFETSLHEKYVVLSMRTNLSICLLSVPDTHFCYEVTYQDLMVAAGHLARKDDFDENREVVKDSPLNYRKQREELNKKFIQIILADLYEKSFEWSVQKEKPEGKIRFPDMSLNIDYEGFNKWYCMSYLIRINTLLLSMMRGNLI